MSFDLRFEPAAGQPVPGAAALAAWLADRPGHGADSPGHYENEDTGVYFAFDLPEPDDGDDDPEDGEADSGIGFDLLVCKSHVFALEAAPEVMAFTQQFGLQLAEPVPDGLAPGVFDPGEFVSAWNAHNRRAVANWMRTREQLRDHSPTLHRPAAELRRYWQWNLACREQRSADADCLPVCLAVRDDGRIQTAVVRPAEPKPTTRVPVTDLLLIPDPRAKKKRPRHSLVVVNDVATGWPMPARVGDDDIPYRDLAPDHLDVGDAASPPEPLEVLLAADILDTELVTAAS